MQTYGILLSHYQTKVNMANLRLAHVDFINQKATEGSNYRDPTYKANVRAARSEGLGVIAFHYIHGGLVNEQVNNFLDYTASDKPDLYEVDFEVNEGRKESMIHDVYTMLDLLLFATDKLPVFYSNPDFCKRYKLYGMSKLAKFSFHIAAYNYGEPPQCYPWADWQLWQKTNKGSIIGVEGGVCIEVCNGRFTDLVTNSYKEILGDGIV